MQRIKFGMGGVLMLSAMMISDSAAVLAVYFAAAFIHELGHLLAAHFLKIGVKEIRFEFSGIRICTEDGLISYRREFLLAMAGPLFNLFGMGVAFVAGAWHQITLGELLICGSNFLSSGIADTGGVLGFFLLSCALQAGTNLLPVKGFDGGRMLYCALAATVGIHIAERVLAIASSAAIFVLWTVALYLMLRISSGLGIYVFVACMFFALVRGEK